MHLSISYSANLLSFKIRICTVVISRLGVNYIVIYYYVSFLLLLYHEVKIIYYYMNLYYINLLLLQLHFPIATICFRLNILECVQAYCATYFNFPFSNTAVVNNNNSLFKQSSVIYSDSRISSEYAPQHASQYYRDTMTHSRFVQTR